jgi:AcrR family transcriptional regulator
MITAVKLVYAELAEREREARRMRADAARAVTAIAADGPIAADGADGAPSRRDRLRAATSQEIIQTARRLLIEQGSAAVSLRAIAREMGMTAPGLYRYFASHETLIQYVVADIFTELSDHIEAAVRSALAEHASAATAESTARGLIIACQAFRDWAVAHPPEFAMIFGSPLPGVELYHDDPLTECGLRFGLIFLRLFTDLWTIKPFLVPADDQLEPSLRDQLARYRALADANLPLGVLQTFLRCWVLLYGTVSLEVFGHLKFALEDSAPMFDLMLTDLASMLGLEYPLPA